MRSLQIIYKYCNVLGSLTTRLQAIHNFVCDSEHSLWLWTQIEAKFFW